jgi:hypothetical protein
MPKGRRREGSKASSAAKREGEERKVNQGKIRVAPGEEEIHPLSFFPLWICLDLDSILV